MRHIFTALILLIMAYACTTLEAVFYIDSTHSVNGKYLISGIMIEENLVTDTVLFNGMTALFNDFHQEKYGNWFGYWHIAKEKHGELLLRMSNDDTYDVVLVCQGAGKYSFHLVARSYGDGADFEQIHSTLKGDILHKTIIKGYYPYVIQSDTLTNSIPTVPETMAIADTMTLQEKINAGN